MSLVSPLGRAMGATIRPFGPGRSTLPATIEDEAASLGNRIAVAHGDPLDPSSWRPAKISEILGHPLTLSGLNNALSSDLGDFAQAGRAILGDLLTESAEIARGLPGRTLALAIEGDASLIARPFVPTGSASAPAWAPSRLSAAFGNVSDGTPTGLLTVKVASASGRGATGGLVLTIRRPNPASNADLASQKMSWDDVIASAMTLDSRDKRDGRKRPGGTTWLESALKAMEANIAEATRDQVP